jgi:Domain of Unknown Function (DUF1080)
VPATPTLEKLTMLRMRRWVAAALLAFAATAADAADDEQGFTPLFDGQTLSGWHKNPQKIGHGTGGDWQVVDGAIVGQQDPPGSGNGGILLTDQKYGDFELRLELKHDWGVDSGLFVRSNDQGQCFQMMVDYHEAGNVGHIYGEGTGGFNNRPFEIFGQYNEQKGLTGLVTKPSPVAPPEAPSCTGEAWVRAWKLEDWNAVTVRAVGNPPKITTWINGLLVSEFDGATFNGPNYDREGVAKLLGPEGSIAVQVHGGQGAWPNGAVCRWRKIRLKPLTP